MHAALLTGTGRLMLAATAITLALGACSKKSEESAGAPSSTQTTTTQTATTTGDTAPAPATSPAAATPAADNTDTLTGVKLASFTGDAAKGETAFVVCKTCHVAEPGVNRIGPSLAGLVGRKAGTVAGYTYSTANKNSGITWTTDKLFQYLEKPQRVVPGTKMTFPGITDPQRRADVIAYLQTK